MTETTKTERPKLGLASDRALDAHIGDPSLPPMVALCGARCKVRDHHPNATGSYCAVCLEINGGPPNWWLK